MISRVRRAAFTCAAAAVAVLALSGCDSDAVVACPAIGYMSTLVITVKGAVPDELELCHEDLCAPSSAAANVGFVVTPPAVSEQTWTFTGMFPEGLTVRAYDKDGTPIASADIEPDWQRTGGSEECGGPTRAELTIHV
jgi:hypothetical protein